MRTLRRKYSAQPIPAASNIETDSPQPGGRTLTPSSSPAATDTPTNTVLGSYLEPEDVEDYSRLRDFFALPQTLAAVDDIAKWLVGLSAVFGSVTGSLGITQASPVLGPHDRSLLSWGIFTFALCLASSALARMPLPMKVNRRSRQSMNRAASTLLWIRGTLVTLAIAAFAASLVLIALAAR
jgi:hypothetical protein